MHFLIRVHWMLLLAGIFCEISNRELLIRDLNELSSKIGQAIPGDVFVLSNGLYDSKVIQLKDIHGKEKSPIVIKAESKGGVTLADKASFILTKCSYIAIEGFVFTCNKTAIKLEGCHHIEIIKNTIRLEEKGAVKWVYNGGVWNEPETSLSHHNKISFNLFENKKHPGHFITIDGSGGNKQSQYDIVEFNHFKNNQPRAKNEKESIRIGCSGLTKSEGFTTVAHNLFESCDGYPEIISVKSCKNKVVHNTIVRSQGSITLRQGNGSLVEGNYIFGEKKDSKNYYGGIRVYGNDHSIVNNVITNINGKGYDAPISIPNGNAKDLLGKDHHHHRAENILIKYNELIDNRYGLEIGYGRKKNFRYPPKNIYFKNNLIISDSEYLIKLTSFPLESMWKNNMLIAKNSARVCYSEKNTHLYIDQISNQNDLEFLKGKVISEKGKVISVRYRPLNQNDVGPDADMDYRNLILTR